MKNRTDKILLAVFLLSLPAYIWILLTYFEIVPMRFPVAAYSLRTWLALRFAAVPAFCLQLLLCRQRRRRISALPALAIAGAALRSAYGLFSAPGWDTLGWLILLCLCIAPAVGCILGWAAYGIHQFCKRGDTHG